MNECLIWTLYYKFTMPEVHKYHQFTIGLLANEFLGPKDNLSYTLDSKAETFCQ